MSDTEYVLDIAEEFAERIVERHGAEPLPRVRRELLGELRHGIERLVRDVDAAYQVKIGTAPQLVPDEAGTRLVLKLWVCPECGARPPQPARSIWPPRCYEHGGQDQSLLDGVEMEWSDYVARKLPDSFALLDSTLRQGVNKRWLVSQQRDLERTGMLTVRLVEVGMHPDNAAAVLSYVARQAGYRPEEGRTSREGEGVNGLVRWFRP